VPYANPIGLSQVLLGSHMGRFSLSSGTNFNRNWMDVTPGVLAALKRHQNSAEPLLSDDAESNVRAVRRLIQAEIDTLGSGPGQRRLEVTMKRELFKLAAQADLVLDLHCDHDAVLHM
jgi:predicted deacylase